MLSMITGHDKVVMSNCAIYVLRALIHYPSYFKKYPLLCVVDVAYDIT